MTDAPQPSKAEYSTPATYVAVGSEHGHDYAVPIEGATSTAFSDSGLPRWKQPEISPSRRTLLPLGWRSTVIPM